MNNDIVTAPNQRTVKIDKDKTDTNNLYTKMNIESLNTALQILRPNAFKLYIYFCRNQNNYTFALSKVDVCRTLNITANTYLTAFNELEKAGYLVKKNRKDYIFYEKLQEQEKKIITVIKETM